MAVSERHPVPDADMTYGAAPAVSRHLSPRTVTDPVPDTGPDTRPDARANTRQSGTVTETDIPTRLDALPFGRFHVLVIVALGITWILDGLEVTLAGAL